MTFQQFILINAGGYILESMQKSTCLLYPTHLLLNCFFLVAFYLAFILGCAEKFFHNLKKGDIKDYILFHNKFISIRRKSWRDLINLILRLMASKILSLVINHCIMLMFYLLHHFCSISCLFSVPFSNETNLFSQTVLDAL